MIPPEIPLDEWFSASICDLPVAQKEPLPEKGVYSDMRTGITNQALADALKAAATNNVVATPVIQCTAPIEECPSGVKEEPTDSRIVRV